MKDELIQPTDWSIRNGAFVGYCLVAVEQDHDGRGMKPAPKDGWLPFAHDLRPITGLKQAEPDHPERTSLYHNGAFVAIVNAPLHAIMPHWISVRHAYDAMATTDEAVRCAQVGSVLKEARP